MQSDSIAAMRRPSIESSTPASKIGRCQRRVKVASKPGTTGRIVVCGCLPRPSPLAALGAKHASWRLPPLPRKIRRRLVTSRSPVPGACLILFRFHVPTLPSMLPSIKVRIAGCHYPTCQSVTRFTPQVHSRPWTKQRLSRCGVTRSAARSGCHNQNAQILLRLERAYQNFIQGGPTPVHICMSSED